MNTYVFKLSSSSGKPYFYAAEAKNQSEAAQKVCARIGGHSFSTMLEKSYAYPSIVKAGYHHKNIMFIE